MLKRIPAILSPELLKLLMEMGHGDEIILADANFPAVSCAQRLIRADGHGIPPLLSAILQLFPLDAYADAPIGLMRVVPGDDPAPPIWQSYERIIEEQTGERHVMEQIERFEFYERAKRAYAVVATGEGALYANILLKKGVIAPE